MSNRNPRRFKTQKSSSANLKKKFSCPLLSEEEQAAVMVHMANIEDPTKGALAVMREHGYFIVPDLLPLEDMQRAEHALRKDLEKLVDANQIPKGSNMERVWKQVVQHGASRLPKKTAESIGNIGRFQSCGFPQGHFAWFCRRHPNIRRVYSILHGIPEDQLTSSMDNSFFTHSKAKMETENRYWPHVDFNENVGGHDFREWSVYQGLVYVWSSEVSPASTTVVWPGSHKPEIFSKYQDDPKTIRRAANGGHFTQLAALSAGPDRDALDQGFRSHARRATVPAGGALFWDSRTTHQGWSGGPRLAQPVCWEPVSRRTALARERKLLLAACGLPSTHWASLGQPHTLVALKKPHPISGRESSNAENVVLPLKPAIRSVALKTHVSPMDVWSRIESVDLKKRLPLDLVHFLEGAILDEFKAIL